MMRTFGLSRFCASHSVDTSTSGCTYPLPAIPLSMSAALVVAMQILPVLVVRIVERPGAGCSFAGAPSRKEDGRQSAAVRASIATVRRAHTRRARSSGRQAVPGQHARSWTVLMGEELGRIGSAVKPTRLLT